MTGSKKTTICLAAVFAVLVFAGWSCGGGSGVSILEDMTPSERVYQNAEWGISFKYPADWQYREYSENFEGEEVEMTLSFSDTPLPETLPPEPIFPIIVYRDARTIDEFAAIHADAISNESITLGGKTVSVITRYSDILEQNYRIYLVPLSAGSMQFLPLDTRYNSVAEDMITTVMETD